MTNATHTQAGLSLKTTAEQRTKWKVQQAVEFDAVDFSNLLRDFDVVLADQQYACSNLGEIAQTAAQLDDCEAKLRSMTKFFENSQEDLGLMCKDRDAALARATLAEKRVEQLVGAAKNVMTFYMGIIGGVTGDATKGALLRLQAAIATTEQP